jgi:hypothetical protein
MISDAAAITIQVIGEARIASMCMGGRRGLICRLALLTFQQCDAVAVLVQPSVDLFSVGLHVLVELLELAGDAFDCCRQPDHGLA